MHKDYREMFINPENNSCLVSRKNGGRLYMHLTPSTWTRLQRLVYVKDENNHYIYFMRFVGHPWNICVLISDVL